MRFIIEKTAHIASKEVSKNQFFNMGMGQNLLLPYLEESTSINQLF